MEELNSKLDPILNDVRINKKKVALEISLETISNLQNRI